MFPSESVAVAVSEADLVRKAMASGAPAEQVLARTVMSTPVMTIDIAQSAHDASDLMAERGIRHLVITEEGRVVGMISVRDLLRWVSKWVSSIEISINRRFFADLYRSASCPGRHFQVFS